MGPHQPVPNPGRLIPEDARFYAEAATALERGYAGYYDQLIQHIDEEGLSVEVCEEVIDILSMFRALKFANDGVLPAGVDAHSVTFRGFDGNNESPYMGYARFYCESDHGRFEERQKDAPSFNSHMRTLDRYRRQLAAWKASADPNNLTEADVRRIADSAHV